MFLSIRNSAISALRRQINRFFPPAAPQLSLAGIPCDYDSMDSSVTSPSSGEFNRPALEESMWFAVPKSKVSRGKKRMKTTLRKRIKPREDIVIDKRTGELTLKGKLPYNWRNYLPGNAEYAP